MNSDKKNSSPSTWLWLLPILILYLNKGSKRLNIHEIETASMEKKARLLNRIKGYMNPEEQLIIHRAEMLLQIVSKVKVMMETPDILASSTYSSLSLEDKKKNMLMDISEFVDEDKRDVIYKSIDMHSKLNHMNNKVKEIQSLDTPQISIESIEKYIELVDPLLEGELQNKTKEIKVIMGILKLMKSMEKKEQLDETDILEIIKPFVSDEQKDQLTRMVQLVKVFGAINSPESAKLPENKEIPLETLTEKSPKEENATEEIPTEVLHNIPIGDNPNNSNNYNQPI